MRTRRSQSSGNPVSSPRVEAPGSVHRTVLLHEAVGSLEIEKNDVVVDATLGGAGHASLILKRLGPDGTFVGFDADTNAIERARNALKDAPCAVHLIQANFRSITSELARLGIKRIDKVLFDLGWSTYQLSEGRGFSFLADEPLKMAYSHEQAMTAETIINEWSEESLADIIYGWGEERYSRRIAKAITEARAKKPIRAARELGEIVKTAVPVAYRFGRLHPATKTFQALRIAVNDELGSLKEGLRAAWDMLGENGRIAVISFHSIEDRIVKQMFVELEKSGGGVRTSKKPIRPSVREVAENPRARSAKLRVIEKKKKI